MNLDALASFPVIRTERLVLRALDPADADAVFAIFGDDDVTRFYDRTTMKSRDEAIELLALLESATQSERESAGRSHEKWTA